MTTAKQIKLKAMYKRHRALTRSIGGTYEEAAAVCLSRHHSSPATISMIDNAKNTSAAVAWTKPTPRVVAAWANTTDATEAGAYGCVIAGVETARGLFAVRRAETGTGADYYVGPRGAGKDDLEDCVRLEVSGVSDGDHKGVERRVMDKVRQAKAGDSDLPALAGVIGFQAKLLVIQDVKDDA